MKANEMPERIYLFDYNDAMVTPLEGDTVYVMEDAFIERAVDWITKNGSYYIGFEQGQPCIDKDFVDKFKVAMKSSE